ncbi:MAG: hypothetical protein WCD79_17715, partial [Chthoniobacteraceae bacterium]
MEYFIQCVCPSGNSSVSRKIFAFSLLATLLFVPTVNLPAQTPAPQPDVFLHPFSPTSPWNTPIAATAT